MFPLKSGMKPCVYALGEMNQRTSEKTLRFRHGFHMFHLWRMCSWDQTAHHLDLSWLRRGKRHDTPLDPGVPVKMISMMVSWGNEQATPSWLALIENYSWLNTLNCLTPHEFNSSSIVYSSGRDWAISHNYFEINQRESSMGQEYATID